MNTNQLCADADETMREVRAEALTFTDALRIREESAQLEIALPRIVTEQRGAGRAVTAIARDLDVTESYVHRLIRQYRKTQQ